MRTYGPPGSSVPSQGARWILSYSRRRSVRSPMIADHETCSASEENKAVVFDVQHAATLLPDEHLKAEVDRVLQDHVRFHGTHGGCITWPAT